MKQSHDKNPHENAKTPMKTPMKPPCIFFSIGKILRPRGLKGELKILSMLSDHDSMKNLETVYIDDQLYTVTKVTVQPGTGIAFMFLKGIDHIDKAERLRGLELKLPADDVELEDE